MIQIICYIQESGETAVGWGRHKWVGGHRILLGCIGVNKLAILTAQLLIFW